MIWDNWHRLAERLGLSQATETQMAERFRQYYTEPHRAYHNLQHIEALLIGMDSWPEPWIEPDSVALCIWFHDLIYQPSRRDNEAQSAAQAVKYLQSWGLPQGQIHKIEQMILATAGHQATGLDADGRAFLDLDLSILGSPAERYNAYVTAIRKEYKMYPALVYKPARKKILHSFLDRERLYFTETGYLRWETQARQNIMRELGER